MFKKCLEEGVFLNQLGYHCTLCNFETCRPSYEMIEQHFKSKSHQDMLDKHRVLLTQQNRNSVCDTMNTMQRKLLVNNRVTFSNTVNRDFTFTCHACNCAVYGMMNLLSHIEGKKHKRALKDKVNLGTEENAATNQQKVASECFTFSQKKAFCKICCYYMSSSKTNEHALSRLHKHQVMTKESNHLSNNLMEVDSNYYTHAAQSTSKKSSTAKTWNSLVNKPVQTPTQDIFKENHTVTHVNQWNLNKQLDNLIKSEPKKLTSNSLVNNTSTDDAFEENHSATQVSQSNLNKMLSNLGKSGSKKSAKDSLVNMKPVHMPTKDVLIKNHTGSQVTQLGLNKMLNNLMKSDLNKLTHKARPHSSKFIMSKSFQEKQVFTKNNLLFGNQYIELCIEPGPNNMYNLNSNKIFLLKLGVSLMFPLKPPETLCFPCNKILPIAKNLIYEHLHDSEHIKNIRTMVDNDKTFVDFPEQFSDLKLAKQYMFQKCDEFIHCYACETNIKDDTTTINLHIKMAGHVEKAQDWKNSAKQLSDEIYNLLENVWYYSQKFLCLVCDTKYNYEMDFVAHLQMAVHLSKVYKLSQKNVTLKFDFCPVCITFWFGKTDAYKVHCESLYHRRFTDNGDFTESKMSCKTIDLLENAEMKVDNLIKRSDETIFEKGSELELLKDIENTVKFIYPHATAYTFGSRISNLGFPTSDVDVFLDCQNKYHEISSQTAAQKILLTIETVFEDYPNIWIIDEVLLDTRVPILKLRHIPASLKCDISVTNGLGVEKSTLVGKYNQAYPICRQLILYLKEWLTSCKLAGSECITTFAICWFVIFYLQTKKILPSVRKLIDLKNRSNVVDGWECGFPESVDVTPSNSSFKDHLKGFFSFYANYDYRTSILCPYIGKSMKKSTFARPESLPTEFALYKQRLKSDELSIFRFDSPMCIQDPLDLSQNITKAVKKSQVRCFKQYCAESYNLIKQS
ncbi:uncharacterized protein LOC106646861 [Copidosoma floridanum]|uniref:uncharacterized protein LOC106646861 n=1 Tax=Copidosoma floridanum TaxID=29053 RepID=UPI0006C9E0C0|nr:uncharacterized protein LOC106646861 [Copidosoma floridanum]